VTAPTAVVFAYADVGARCLQVLLSAGVRVSGVVTHVDDPTEHRWFADVAAIADDRRIPCVRTDRADDPRVDALLREVPLDFIFSFYFRRLLPSWQLQVAKRGAFNVHGSLLPRYRGRAPVNWAILRGETETGATLHHMTERADAGDVVDQQRVPILADDTALDVTRKVTVAAELVLERSLPRLLDGTAPRVPQPTLPGHCFGRRRPEDGRIDWSQPAKVVHDLVRAVAPPFPGAFTDIGGVRWWLHATRLAGAMRPPQPAPLLFARDGRCYAACADGNALEIRALAGAHGAVDALRLAASLEPTPLG
jgi:methionyl-tRNA formyltransferase